mmetsp:Transcript_18040/g.40360  ORF Transcript_18040/g.40360 Transcript_18040/m.40360 type:complete len:199 (-) Transcript_18040:81-677(-)
MSFAEASSKQSRLLALAQAHLADGEPASAVQCLEQALLETGDQQIEVHLSLAEALWQEAGRAGTAKSLPHYEAAAVLALSAGDTVREGMIALGHGFALSQLGEVEAARDKLSHAESLAVAAGNERAADFARGLLAKVNDARRQYQAVQEQVESIDVSLKADDMDAEKKMPCGHSCKTCPTKHECTRHGKLVDLEDLGG